jgi:predicted CXXCH cytochrome family protein
MATPVFSLAATSERIDPHSAKGCIHCHPPLGPGEQQRTVGPSLITSNEPNHKTMTTVCQTCHKGREFDFWILVFPKGGGPGIPAPMPPTASATPVPAAAAPSSLSFAKLAPMQVKIAQAIASKKTKVTVASGKESKLEMEKRVSGGGTKPSGTNPHKDLGCPQCHKTKPLPGIDTIASVDLAIPDFDDVALCGNCHARENIHPTGMAIPEKDGFRAPPRELPLAPKGKHKGKISCITCHDIHAEGEGYALLRGIPKAFPGRKEFCEACHTSWKGYPSPHKGSERSCALCHSTDPLLSAQVVLRVDPLLLCNFCHPRTDQAHYLRFDPFADATITSLLPTANLPGVPGKVSCNSCHEPHGVTPFPSLLREQFVTLSARSVRVYPHGKEAFCSACHKGEPSKDPQTLRENGDMVALCNRCHASGQVKGEIHPVGVRSSERTWKMDFVGWPLEKGMLTCRTCHAHSEVGTVAKEQSSTLRGGPYAKRSDFCIKCHEEAGFKEINPHIQMTSEGDIIPRSCLACHSSIPDANGAEKAGPAFRMDMLALCRQCHDVSIHPAGVEHLVIPSDSIHNRMDNYQEKYDVVYPLDKDGRITCSTCHNPHQSGVVKGKFELGADESNRQRLPTWKGMLCAPCHGGGGLK